MIKNEIALKYAKGLANYCANFKDCGRYCGCIFYVDGGCVLAQDSDPGSWDLEDVKLKSTDREEDI